MKEKKIATNDLKIFLVVQASVEEGRAKGSVSAWRRLMVANEFNELQIKRVFQTNWSLIILICILYGGGFQYLSTAQPDGTDLDPEIGILFFCFTSVTAEPHKLFDVCLIKKSEPDPIRCKD